MRDQVVAEEVAREDALNRTHPQSVMERVVFNGAWHAASEFFGAQESWDAYLCPKCGLVLPDTGSLIEGHDGTIFGSYPEGDGYTGEMFCDSSQHHGEVLPVEEIQVRRVPC
jgi:hypothetical protein